MAEQQSDCASSELATAGEANALGREANKLIGAREFDAARACIERGLALAPDNAMLAHTKAHLSIDSGAFLEGAEYLRAFLATHDPFEGVNIHTAWHLAYIELELGHPAAALDWHRRVVAPTLIPMTFYGAVSLLWRYEVRRYGRETIRPDWEELRRAAQDIGGSSSLDDLARAMVFIAVGDEHSLARLRERLAAASADPVASEVVLPMTDGFRAYWQGDLAGAIDRLEPLTPLLGRLSEFPDQLSVAHETLNDARARALASPVAVASRRA